MKTIQEYLSSPEAKLREKNEPPYQAQSVEQTTEEREMQVVAPVSSGSAPSALAVEGYMRNRQTLVERLCEISNGPMWNGYDKALKGIREDIAVIDSNVTTLLNAAIRHAAPDSKQLKP